MFDNVTHKYLDESLGKSGASRKTRAMFLAIYAAAEVIGRVRGLNGGNICGQTFKVRRGVIQDDIISLIFFILALGQLFRVHDPRHQSVSHCQITRKYGCSADTLKT